MVSLRRRSLLVLGALSALLAFTACVNPLDPLDHEDQFRRLQKQFTAYVRWGKVHEAAVYVVKDQRQEFLSLAPELSEIRFTDYEIARLDYHKTSADADVILRGYRLDAPVERVVHLAQRWEKDDSGWQVRLQLAEIKSGLGSAR